MQMITFLVFSIISLLVILVVLPHLLFRILKAVMNLEFSELKLYNINHYKGIFIKTSKQSLPIWGFKSIIVHIPDFIIKVKKFKIKILINRMQVFMIKQTNELHKVRIIDGIMQPNLLMNFMSLILERTNLKQIWQKQQKLKSMNEKKRKQKQKQKKVSQSQGENKRKYKNRFKIILQGSIQFLIMMVLQHFQILFQDASLNISSSVPEANSNQIFVQSLKIQKEQQHEDVKLNFSSAVNKKQSLLLLQYLAEQTLLLPKIQVKVQIINHHQQQIQIYLPQYQLINWQHVNQPFLQGKQIVFGIRIPFMLVFTQALKRIQFKIQVQGLKFDTVPEDYESLVKFIKMNTFDPQQLFTSFFNNFNSQKINQQDQNFVKVSLDIKNVCIKLHSLYEPKQDSLNAKQYLSNIKEAIVNLQSVSLKQKKFQIKNTNLNVQKFCHNYLDSSELQNQIQTSMIKIPNLVFNLQEDSTLVTHQEAELICQRQEVTLLGKLFTIINNRLSLDQYQEIQYSQICQKFLAFRNINQELLRLSPKKIESVQNLTKQEWIDFIFYYYLKQPAVQTPQKKLQISTHLNERTKKFKYAPSSLHFRLKVQKLQHQLTLTNSSYQQVSCMGQAKHFLKINSLILAYMGTKEFGISKLDFIFRQVSTLHELGLFIESIQMKQNELTLIEYLCGWTVLKKLLQLDQKKQMIDDNEYVQLASQFNNKGKMSKKTISIKKINFEYNKETIVVKQLKVQKNTLPNGKISKLYFSLDRCQVNSLLKFNIKNSPKKKQMQTNEKKKQVEQSKNNKLCYKSNKNKHNSDQHQKKESNMQDNLINFTVFSIDSVTINTTLKIFQKKLMHHKSIQKQKQRSLIHIKNPQINLPYFDASYKLMEYLKTYAEMHEHVDAYLKNVTDDQIAKLRKNIREFLIQPQSILLKISQFGITIQQLPMDTHLQNFNRLIRQYLSKIQYQNLSKISELQILSNIAKNKKKGNLCSFKIQQISIQVNPFDSISSQNKQSINYWIQTFYNKLQHKKQKTASTSLKNIQSQQIRLRKVYAEIYKVQIKKIQFQLRDYPRKLVIVQSIATELSSLTTSNIFNSKKHYFQGNFNIGKIQINVGLGMMSGFSQIFNKFSLYIDVIDKFKQTQDFLNAFKNRQNNKKQININKIQKVFQPWWHILFYSSRWNMKIKKQTTCINLYTGITPYSEQHFGIQIGNFQATSQRQFTQLIIKQLKIKLQNIQIISLINIKSNALIIYDENLNFRIKLQGYTQKKGQIILDKKTIDFVTQIKQLRKDWLIIFGLTQDANDQLISQNKDLQTKRMNYIQIFKLAANNMLEKGQKQLSFFSVLKQIQLNFYISDFQVSLSNNFNFVQLDIKNLSFNHQVFVHDEVIKNLSSQQQQKSNWQILKSNLKMQTIIGKIYQKCQIKEKQLNSKGNQIIFLVAQLMQIKFNQYLTLDNQLIYVRKYMSNQSLKTYISVKIKKAIQKLLQGFSTQKIIKFANQNKQKMKFKIKPIDRFRRAVYKVIKINRLNKLKKQNSKIYNFYSVFKKIEITMESNKNTMIVSSQKQSSLAVSIQYHQNDVLFDHMFQHICFKLKNASISIMQGKKKTFSSFKQQKKQKLCRVSYSQQLSVDINLLQTDGNANKLQQNNQIHLFSKGKVILKQGSIQLSPKNKNLLKQFSQFIIQMTDNKEQKKKQFKRILDKYAQMMRHGKQKLKNKIEWNQSDLMDKQEQAITFQWLFQLKKMSITLHNQIKQNIKIQFGQTAVLTSNKPFLQIQSQNIGLNLLLFDNDKIRTNISISSLRILNLLEKVQNSDYLEILSMNHSDKLAFNLSACAYDVKAFSDLVWDYYRDIHIHLNPIKIKITQELYQVLYTFLFPDMESNQIIQIEENMTSKLEQEDAYGPYIPDLIKKLKIDQLKLQIWYRTDSILKRMDGINVNVKEFSLNNEFFTKKQIFDELVKFLLKQLAGQIFNVIGQKIFGSQ